MKLTTSLLPQIIGLVLLSTTTYVSATPVSIIEKINLEGTIGKSPVLFDLTISGNSVRGNYVYTKYMTPIAVSGTLKKEKLRLTEASKASNKPLIIGTLDSGGIDGHWISEKKLPLKLISKSASYKEILKNISLKSANEKVSLAIEMTDGKTQSLLTSSYAKHPKLIFQDLDFDGYQDLRIPDFDNSTNDSYTYFRYSPSERIFTPFTSPTKDIVSPKIIYSQKLLTGLSKDGCCNYTITFIRGATLEIAQYNYISKTGTLITKNSKNTKTHKTNLTESEFESKYLNKINGRL